MIARLVRVKVSKPGRLLSRHQSALMAAAKGGSMPKSYLPEAADSRLINLEQLGSPENIATEMRLRLHILPRLLFGDRIFMSEGWALDSIPFLSIASEILDAVSVLTSWSSPPAGIEQYAPIRVETRQSDNYLGTFISYLSRPECEWSGFPILRESEDARTRLKAQLEALVGQRRAVSAEEVSAVFGEILESARIGRAIGRIAAYTNIRKAARLSRSVPYTVTFLEQLKDPLEAFDGRLRRMSSDLIPEMNEFQKVTQAEADGLNSTSSVLSAARREGLTGIYPGLEHLVRATYMRITTQTEKAAYGAPIVKPNSSDVVLHAEAALAGAAERPEALEFAGEIETTDGLFEQLSTRQDWRDVWTEVISLALREDWQLQVEQFRAEAANVLPGSSVFDCPSFRRIEKMLEENCSSLVLTRTVADRIGLRFKVMGKPAGEVLDTALKVGAIAGLTVPTVIYLGPTTALWGLGGGLTLHAAATKWVDAQLRLFSRPANPRSSLFRLFKG